jgi:(E)-4-hydroxy-3-methylbut-2-enyl-diphosphate synthase
MALNTKQVRVGSVLIGGGAPVSVQSMTNTDTRDAAATARQILRLEKAGCEIARISVYDEDCARAIGQIKKQVHIPLVADIHFDHRLALLAIEGGIDKLRINPGNIGSQQKVKEVAAAARDQGVPIRIGVNAGSLEKQLLEKYGSTPEAMVESALSHAALLEKEGFEDIVVSLKASDVAKTVAAARLFAQKSNYPQHIGVTEAGSGNEALIKAAAGVGSLLLDGIGDTVRVSITGDPVKEPRAAWDILKAVGVRKKGIELISCPTCGRTSVDLPKVVAEVKRRLPRTDTVLKVAVMGCVVNGPGEAKDADIGIAFAPGGCAVFKKGVKMCVIEREEAVQFLVCEIRNMLDERGLKGE